MHEEVWYQSTTHGFVNRSLAYLLLLLFPLQSQAAVAVFACHAQMQRSATAVAEHVMEDCQDAAMMQQTLPDAGIPVIKRHAEASRMSQSPPCGMSSGCLALASIAVLPDIRVVLSDPAMQSLAFTDEFYLSCIPEGPERPLRLIRAYV